MNRHEPNMNRWCRLSFIFLPLKNDMMKYAIIQMMFSAAQNIKEFNELINSLLLHINDHHKILQFVTSLISLI